MTDPTTFHPWPRVNSIRAGIVTCRMQLPRLSWVLAGLLTVALRAAPAVFHVDPNGRDAWSGKPAVASPGKDDGPLRTLPAALALARESRRLHPDQPVEIVVLSGRHELSAPLEFGPDDSGITLTGSGKRLRPTLSGGTILTGWNPSPTNADVWEVTLPEVAQGKWYFHQLFVGDERAQRARTPNDGFFLAAAPLSRGSPIELTFRDADIRPQWATHPDARLVMLAKWTDLHLPIAGVDAERHVARLPGGPRPFWMDEPNARYWVENVPDALDSPGEWYLDRATGVLRYWAPKGINPNAVQVVAPRLTELLRWRGSGDGKRPVTNVTVRGLRFADCDYTMPREGLQSPQAAVLVPGSLNARHAVDCRIETCRFETLGGYGLELGRGCQRWTVSGCEFGGLGGGGIRVGEPGDKQPSDADANHSNRILDNGLFRLGRVFAPSVGIIVFQSGTNRIAHNHIRDLYYTGISVGWNWGYQSTPCRANEIDHNLVELVGQGKLSDMGGVYTLGPQPGTTIHHNVFHDIASHDYGGWGLYTDEGSSGILLENNIVYRCKSAGFHQHYGRDNVVRNNIFAFNREHGIMRTRVEDHLSFKFLNNIVVQDSGTLFGGDWSGSTNQVFLDGNLYWDTRHGLNAATYRFGKETWSQWHARDLDVHSAIGDPQLLSPRRPDLGIQNISAAHALGFADIEFHILGRRSPGNRD
ncbi:MAG: right-handed parallel beta-helix repeat-containing protein [Verrucomicrobia bacterium]|nr:MAG: right-handed parallel beta-helix repeat-containing protein [Verrucomicrobiota bacterium]